MGRRVGVRSLWIAHGGRHVHVGNRSSDAFGSRGGKSRRLLPLVRGPTKARVFRRRVTRAEGAHALALLCDDRTCGG